MLQWGHDKIVMEVSTACLLSVIYTPLQWGHDKIVMEVSEGRQGGKPKTSFNGAMTK